MAAVPADAGRRPQRVPLFGAGLALALSSTAAALAGRADADVALTRPPAR